MYCSYVGFWTWQEVLALMYSSGMDLVRSPRHMRWMMGGMDEGEVILRGDDGGGAQWYGFVVIFEGGVSYA